jgi:hypothetical protein
VAYENLERFFQRKMITGNPVRQDLMTLIVKEAAWYFNLDATKKNTIGSWWKSWSKKSKSVD